MSDDDILMRGGDEDDIRKYAEANGVSQHPTLEQRAHELFMRLFRDYHECKAGALDELTAIIRENEELKEQINPRNGHTFESLTKMWEDGHIAYAAAQSELTQLRKVCDDLRKHPNHYKCNDGYCGRCLALANYNNLPHLKGKL